LAYYISMTYEHVFQCELATYCANWLKAETHIDSIFPKDNPGSYKWPWRAVEDSMTCLIVNKSNCPSSPCTLSASEAQYDVFSCSLYIEKPSSDTVNVFWYVDFLKGGNRFRLYSGDYDTVTIEGPDTISMFVEHDLTEFDNLPETASPVSANGCVGIRWIENNDTTIYVMDQDCFRFYIKE
jgi:hypothetical protein